MCGGGGESAWAVHVCVLMCGVVHLSHGGTLSHGGSPSGRNATRARSGRRWRACCLSIYQQSIGHEGNCKFNQAPRNTYIYRYVARVLRRAAPSPRGARRRIPPRRKLIFSEKLRFTRDIGYLAVQRI